MPPAFRCRFGGPLPYFQVVGQGSYNRAEPSEKNLATAKGWGPGNITAPSGMAQQDPLSERTLRGDAQAEMVAGPVCVCVWGG